MPRYDPDYDDYDYYEDDEDEIDDLARSTAEKYGYEISQNSLPPHVNDDFIDLTGFDDDYED